MKEVILDEANLDGADLTGAKLDGADLDGAIFTTTTILPDGTPWLADRDLSVFTDPDHPDYVDFYLETRRERCDFSGWFPTDNISKRTDLMGWDFTGCTMHYAYLASADLQDADLTGASLRAAHLSFANLDGAVLRGADRTGAELLEASLEGAIFDTTTILPDGNPWSADRDLGMFTDPKHPDFSGDWRYLEWLQWLDN